MPIPPCPMCGSTQEALLGNAIRCITCGYVQPDLDAAGVAQVEQEEAQPN